jgi:DNA-binding LacI/PurR family transcriptional regulator
VISAFDALHSRQRVREIAARAHADERTVKRVLRGEWKHNNAEERILAAMEELGVRRPLGIVKIQSSDPAESAAR